MRGCGSTAGLSLEVVSSLCNALLLADVFVFSYGSIAVPFQMPLGSFVVLVGYFLGLIMGISGLIYSKKKAVNGPVGIKTWAILAAQKPIGHRRIATYVIVAIIAIFIFFGTPIIPFNNGCMNGVFYPITVVSHYGYVC